MVRSFPIITSGFTTAIDVLIIKVSTDTSIISITTTVDALALALLPSITVVAVTSTTKYAKNGHPTTTTASLEILILYD
jgi:hypothetical protein